MANHRAETIADREPIWRIARPNSKLPGHGNALGWQIGPSRRHANCNWPMNWRARQLHAWPIRIILPQVVCLT